MDYSIQTKKYEGPMDLLFDLISRNKIDIRDISIVEITNQYIDYVDHVKSTDMDLASDFIMMAARLLEIKSRYLLYIKDHGQDEQDPRLELIDQIEEYKKYRQIVDILKINIKEYDHRFYRKPEENDSMDDECLDLTRINLDEVKFMMPNIIKLLSKIDQDKPILEKNSNLRKIVENKNISVEDRIILIRSKISSLNKISFEDSLECKDKREVIASFLAILELIKLKEIKIQQYGINNDIIIIKREDKDK